MERNFLYRYAFAGALVAGIAAQPAWGGPAPGPGIGALARCMAAKATALHFSGVALIEHRGRTTTYSSGMEAGPGSAPITVGSQFNLGSASKMFTAVAVAQLIEAGKIGFDDPISRYVSGLAPAASKVTVQQLLSHSSGLGNYFTPENLHTIEGAHSLRELLPLVANDVPAFTPGSRFAYSNSGFLLLGLLIEEVSHQSYIDYLRQHIFAPAHMIATSMEPGPRKFVAIGMTAMLPPAGPESGHGPQVVTRASNAPPTMLAELRRSSAATIRASSAGGMYSTASDMKNFFSALLDGRLISPAMLKTLVTPRFTIVPAKDGRPEVDYGFGFGTGFFRHHRWFGHNGGLPGGNTEANAFPDDGVAIEVMANRDPPMASRLYEALRQVVFDPPALSICASGKVQTGRAPE